MDLLDSLGENILEKIEDQYKDLESISSVNLPIDKVYTELGIPRSSWYSHGLHLKLERELSFISYIRNCGRFKFYPEKYQDWKEEQQEKKEEDEG